MGKKKRGPGSLNLPVGTKKGTLRIAPCIMIRDGGRYRIWVSEATMKGLLEIQSQLLLSSYDEVLSVLLASYKEVLGRRHNAQSERLNDWCWNSPVQRTDSCEQSSSSTMQSATSVTVHREKSSKPALVGIIGNQKATSKREQQPCETYSIVKEEYVEDTLTEQDPLQEGKSGDRRTESERTLQKSGQPRGPQGFFLKHGNLEDRRTPLLEDKSGDCRTERERTLQMSENPRGTFETSLDRESRLTGESRSTVLSTQDQQEGSDISMKEEESEDDLSYADDDISDDGDNNHKNLVHPSDEGNLRSSMFLMKKEPEGDGSSGGGRANETPSCSQQGGNSSMQSTSQGTGHTEEMSGDKSCDRSHGKALPKDFLLQGVQGNHSEFLMGQVAQVHFAILPLPNKAENPQVQSVADRATLPDPNDERLDGDLAVGCGVKCDKTSGDASCDRSYAQGQKVADSATISDGHDGRSNGDIAVGCSMKCDRAGDVSLCRSHSQRYCSVDGATVSESDHEDERLDGNIAVGHDEKHEISGDASQDRSSKGQSAADCSSVSNHDDGKVDRPIAVEHDEKHVHVTNSFQNKQKKSSVLCAPRSTQTNPHSKSREDRPFVCTVCNRGFSRKDNLTTHMKIHQAKRRRDQCPFCKKKFLCSNYLRMHIKVHTGEELYVCSFCKKTFFKRQSLDEHVRTHTGEKPFQCSYCNMRFARADAFKRHTQSHKRETCPFCDKTFSQAGDLKTHMKKHSAEKPFQCADCGHSFATKLQVVDHQKTHAGEEPNFCSVCDKRFKRKHDFIRHMRVHTGEKPYHCPVCSKSFSAKRSRNRHMKMHSG